VDDKWYIYVAASDGDNATHRMHVLERAAADPFGPFTYKGQISAATNRWAIDGTVLQWQGKNYFVWSGWPGFTDGRQNLYIAEMLNPWTLATDRVMISTPQYSWEMHGLPINEGPQILIEDGKLHIIYSASGFWTPQYALGRLTYNGTGSLLNANSWTKAPQPVFQAAGSVVGVGHASFTTSPDGSENWIVYHAHRDPPAPSGQELRDVRIQRFSFTADGAPSFGAPLPLNQTMTAPSTGIDAERPFVVGDYNADGAVDAGDQLVWQATFGAEIFPGTAADGSGDGTIDAADYIIWRRALGSEAAASSASTTEPTASAMHEQAATSLTTAPPGPGAFDAAIAEIAAEDGFAITNRRASQSRLVSLPPFAIESQDNELLLAARRPVAAAASTPEVNLSLSLFGENDWRDGTPHLQKRKLGQLASSLLNPSVTAVTTGVR
jgi:GH43 family beta-xylosidase